MRRGKFAHIPASGRWAALLPALLLFCALAGPAAASERALTFYNIHTKEETTVAYKRGGEYLPGGLKKLNYALRDWREDEPTDMDPELLDLIWEIYRDLGSSEPIHLISGYRSQKTNNKLRKTRGGQAKKSQHILGKAADIHFPDVDVKTLRNSALVREVGGVGYYPKSGIPFVHVDTGRVRHWPRLPRMELAALFPGGKSKHVPGDGKPITLADARRAGESGKYAGPPKPVMVAAADVKPARTAASASAPTASLPAETSGKPEKKKAPLMTAGLGSDSLGAFMRAAGITGSIPEPVAPPPGYKGSAMQLASASPAAAIPAFPSLDGPETTPGALAASARDHEEEHPEELYYEPFPVLPLMSATPLSRETRAVALVAPEFGNAGYLLSRRGLRLALELKPYAGVRHVASAWEFTGSAVRDLTAPEEEPAPRPAGEVMTASSPAPAPVGGPAGYGGGVSMGLR